MTKCLPIALLNPHADDFIKTPVSFWLVRRRGLGKYAYLIDEPAKTATCVDILIDGTLSSLFGQGWFAKLPRWIRLPILRVEVAFWLHINNLTDKVVVHWSPDTIVDHSILYIFSYKNCVGAFKKRQAYIERFQIKLINLSHYFIRTKEKADNIASLTNVTLTGESDLRHSTYFNHFFIIPYPFIVLPFAINPRFKLKIPISKRAGICAATGSFHNLQNETPASYYFDFTNFFKIDTYHPVRKLLFEHRTELKDWLDCRISKYREKGESNTRLRNLLTMSRLDVLQTKYFSFDMVDFFNNRQFAIVGEEASGSPTIGFFEGMACGCVMLGQQGSFYEGLDLEPDVHYVEHTGTIESIRHVLHEVSANPTRLDQLSQAGVGYVTKNCGPQSVWCSLQTHLVHKLGAS
jgi:hypothetical protein